MIQTRRLPDNPIITPDMLPGADGANINGPSMIRVPSWVDRPLGRYYLYFAHHGGTYIRLAYAEAVEGPWRIHPGGVLRLDDAPTLRGHIASPDVLVDDREQTMRLYYHGPSDHPDYPQASALAISRDGLSFTTDGRLLAPYYLRVFQYGDAWYGFVWGGHLFRSPDGIEPFESVYGEELRFRRYLQESELSPAAVTQPSPFDHLFFGRVAEEGGGHLRIRHLALDLQAEEQRLVAYFTCTGGQPERVQRASIDLRPDWHAWEATELEEVLGPEEPWEGANLPLTKSCNGSAKPEGEQALRDPAIYREGERAWLLYCVRGERGIAIAELNE